MKRKRVPILVGVICLALIIAVMPFVGACAPGKPAPTPEKPLVLKYHCPFPPSYLSEPEEWWMDEVEKRTGGKVKFDRIFGGTLGTLDEQPMAIKGGVFDVGMTCNVYNPGLYPASTVVILPFITDSHKAHGFAAHELFNQSAIEAEFTALNSKFMFNGLRDPQEILSSVPLRTIDDLKTVKLRAHGGSADALAAVGIATYAVPWDEVPAAAERGVIDAACCGAPISARDFGLYDVFPYWVRIRYFYFLPLTMTMNLDTWNNLPSDIQKVMTELNGVMPEQATSMFETEKAKAWQFLQEQGMEEVEFDKADLTRIRDEGAKPVWDKWVEEMEAQGIPGQELLDECFRLLTKYGG